jgi:hypothetical protein
MAIVDSQGRLFGKVSILDVGAALIILAVLAGIFVFPSTSGSSIAQSGASKPVEVTTLVKGLSTLSPDAWVAEFKQKKKTKLIVRNQEYGEVDVKSVERVPELVIIAQPDGSAKALPNPIKNDYSVNMLIVLGGTGKVSDGGVVLGNTPVKIGTVLELEGADYNFKASVIDIKVLNQPNS